MNEAETLNDESVEAWSKVASISLNGRPMEERKSGLLIVAEPPKPYVPKYPLTQIQHEESRSKVRRAMLAIYGILNDKSCGIVLPDDPSPEMREVYNKMWKLFGEMMIGEINPEDREVKC